MSTRRIEADLAVQSLRLTERAAPATPPTGNVFAYAKTDGLLYTKNDAGVETPLGGGGGGSDPWTVLKLGTDAVNNTTNTANVGIGFTAAANTTYLVHCYLPIQTVVSTTGILLALGGPTSGNNYAAVRIHTPSTGTADFITNTSLNTYTAATQGLTSVALAMIFALISVGPTPAAGDVRVLFKSELATSAVTVKAGAVLMYRTL